MIDTKQFEQDVYEIVRQIPSGKVISYGGVAQLAGYPNHSRLVGRLMSQCPLDSDIPCHRVVNAQGSLSCVFRDQRKLLKEEGVIFKTNGNVDMQACDFLCTHMGYDVNNDSDRMLVMLDSVKRI